MKNFHYFLSALFVTCTTKLVSQIPALPDTAVTKNVIFDSVEKEAAFPGGTGEWIKFLERNLNASVPVEKDAPMGRYTVLVQFVVDKTGAVSDVHALTNLGYGMEQEVVRIIKLSGLWEPAMQNNRPVKAYRRQPVTFVVETDEYEIKTATPFVLYTRTDNRLEVSVNKVKKSDLQLTISKGTILQTSAGEFIAKVSSPGRVIIKIFNNKKEEIIGEVSFEVIDKPMQ